MQFRIYQQFHRKMLINSEQTTASMAGLNEAIRQLSVAAKELQGLSEDLEKDMSFFTI